MTITWSIWDSAPNTLNSKVLRLQKPTPNTVSQKVLGAVGDGTLCNTIIVDNY